MYRSRDDKDGTIVYVGGLLADVKKEDIESEFEKFGNLVRVWVAFNPPGFAFVEFSKKDDAEAAVNSLHNATILGSKLRVEISRGRGKGGRGGRDSDRGGRGSFRGSRPDIPGRGSSRGGYGGGRPTPYDRNGDMRGRGGFGGRFRDYEDRRRPEFDERDLLDARRVIGGGTRDFGEDPPRYGGGRDFRDIDGPRGYGDRDIGGRDFLSRDIGGRDFPTRDIGGIPPRDIAERDFLPRNFSRDFGLDRDANGMRGYGGNTRDVPYSGGRDLGSGRNYNAGQSSIPSNDFGGPARDIGGGRNFATRDIEDLRDFGGSRDIGLRREAVRDFNPPRDIDNLREFGGGRAARGMDFPDNDKFGVGGGRGAQRPGGFDGGRFSGGDIGGSGNYDGYDARDRFRSRSPIGRGRY